MKKYSITLFGFFASITLYISIAALDFDLFEKIFELLMRFEHLEFDEIIVPLLMFLAFALCDHLRRRKVRQVDVEKLKIYRAMLRSTHHVLNNFLNQMQLFKMAADKTPDFPASTLQLYNQIILEAQQKIEALGNIEKIEEGDIWNSVTPKP